ncbi:MAG: PP2C family protein-serine/threonine phosphatase, partial [Ktedonobacteraceae bacterium]
MQAEVPIVKRLTHAYVTYRATRLLCILAVLGAALLLFLLSGGFPPWAWRFLVQTAPHVSTLLAQRGQVALVAFLGLMLLAVTILLAWWALLWLAWRMLFYEFYERRELQRFATDMYEAHSLAQAEKTVCYVARSPYSTPLMGAEETYLEDEEAYKDELAAIWPDADVIGRSSPRPLHLVGTKYAQGHAERAVSYTPITPIPTFAEHTYTDDLQYSGSPIYTDDLQFPDLPIYTDDLQHRDLPVQTDDLQYTDYGLFSPFTSVTVAHMPPTPLVTEISAQLHPAVYEQESWSTVPLASLSATMPELASLRATTQLVVGTGLDAGLKRKGKPNEDNLLAIQNTRVLRGCNCPMGLFVIADGMGGHENGQEASRLVIQSLSTTLAPSLITGPADDNYAELLAESVHRANLALYQRNRQKQTDMGTTLAAALVINTTAYIANVGDSRVYLYRSASGLSQVTRDHSNVARLVEAGALQPEAIYTHPRRNEIYRSLGHQASQDVDSFILAVQP